MKIKNNNFTISEQNFKPTKLYKLYYFEFFIILLLSRISMIFKLSRLISIAKVSYMKPLLLKHFNGLHYFK